MMATYASGTSNSGWYVLSVGSAKKQVFDGTNYDGNSFFASVISRWQTLN
jgi:hypothetical protein